MMQAAAKTETPPVAELEATCLDLAGHADAAKRVSAQCDAICLKVGSQLCDAVPTLNDLSGRFAALSATLDDGDLALACGALETIAEDVAAIGDGLSHETEALGDLIKLNVGLSRQIMNLAEDVRFLSAMITSVKVESASIHGEAEGLLGFAADLARLASNAQATIDTCQATHDSLLSQLRRASRIQVDFEMNHRADLDAVARGIEESLATVVARRRAIASAASEVGHNTQRIGSQIGQSVVALQIGDTTRQRIEHVTEALLMPLGRLRAPGGAEAAAWEGFSDPALAYAIERLCRLETRQITEAADEFLGEVGTITRLLSDLSEATSALRATSSELFASREDRSLSFLGDLEMRLRRANGLIDAYRASRLVVDGITNAVIATFAELERFGQSIAAMVIDMTIIGTNAIVKSYRLGQRGAGLSIIAQHLRSHSLRIADGIKTLTPALRGALSAAEVFAKSIEGQGAERVTDLGGKMGSVLTSFNAAGTTLGLAIQQLEQDSDNVGRVLNLALANLGETGELVRELRATADRVAEIADDTTAGAQRHPEVDDVMDRLLLPRYTMASERKLHNAFFGRGDREAATPPSSEVDAFMF